MPKLLALSPLAAICWTLSLSAADEPVLDLDPYTVHAQPVLEAVQTTDLGDSITIVGAEQIEALNANDLAGALRRVPGVTVSRYNPVGAYGGADGGAVFVRGHGTGRPGAEISTLIDGVPRFVGVWTHPLLDVVSVDIAENFKVYRSPQPVRFGNMAFGGVDLSPKTALSGERFFQAEAAAGAWDTYLGKVEGSSQGVYFLASHRESDGHRADAAGRVDTVYANAGLQISSEWSANFLVLYTNSVGEDPGDERVAVPPPVAGITPEYEVESPFAILTFSHDYENLSGEVKIFYEHGNLDWRQRHVPPPAPFAPQELNTYTDYTNYGLQWRETYTFSDRFSLSGGADYLAYGGEVTEDYAQSPDSFFDRTEFRTFSPWALGTYALTADSELSLGLRGAFARFFDPEWGAQVGYQYRLSRATLYANASRSYNYPGAYVAVFGERPAPWGLGQAWQDLDAETIGHFEIGASDIQLGTVGDGDLSGSLSLFHDTVENAIDVAPPPPLGTILNGGEYSTYGGEASLHYQRETLGLFFGAAYLETDPGDRPRAPRWSLSGGLAWQPQGPQRGWSFHLDGQYVAEQLVLNPRFPGAADPLDAYFLVGGRIAYTFDLEPATLEIYLAGENLTDTDYAYRPGYPMPGINATLGLKARF